MTRDICAGGAAPCPHLTERAGEEPWCAAFEKPAVAVRRCGPKLIKLALKKQKLRNKLKRKKPMKQTLASLLLCASAALLSGGCQTADPASRSNRASYRDIYAEVNGGSNCVTITIGDGLYASADGGGDRQDSAATQTTDTRPEVAVGVGGGSAGTGGASPSSGIVGAALEKLVSILDGSAPAGTKLSTEEAAAITECVGCNCEPTAK